MVDQSFKGFTSEPRHIDVEKGQLKFFAHATGETNPIYFGEAAARAPGPPALPAPPTFTFSLALGAPPTKGNLLGDIGVDMQRILHGEQSFTYHRPIYAGETITLITTTSDICEKKGGARESIVQDTKASNAAGELCVDMRVATVVRNG